MCLDKKRTFLDKSIEINREMWHNVVVRISYCSAVDSGRRDHTSVWRRRSKPVTGESLRQRGGPLDATLESARYREPPTGQLYRADRATLR